MSFSRAERAQDGERGVCRYGVPGGKTCDQRLIVIFTLRTGHGGPDTGPTIDGISAHGQIADVPFARKKSAFLKQAAFRQCVRVSSHRGNAIASIRGMSGYGMAALERIKEIYLGST